MRLSGLFWRIFLAYAGLICASSLGLSLWLERWQRESLIEREAARLESVVQLLCGQLEADVPPPPQQLRELLRRFAGETLLRLTVIDARGRVLADSHGEAATDDGLARLPEIRGAVPGRKFGRDRRPSETRDDQLLYVAHAWERDGELAGFVRAAASLAPFERQAAAVWGWIWLGTAATVLAAWGLTFFFVGRTVRPLLDLAGQVRRLAAEGDETASLAERRDEVSLLTSTFRRLERKLDQRVRQLQENSERLQTVLGSMAEGVIAVSPDRTILLANEAGRRLLEFTTPEPWGRPLLEVTRSRAVHAAVAEALLSAEDVEKEFEAPGPQRRVLALRAARLPGDPCPGVVLVLRDVSELRRLENLRREFVANVSHELKTPLAIIKATAETLRLGAINDAEHNLNFVRQIEDQSERLHELIIDLIQIARVESGEQMFDIVDVRLAEVIEDCDAQYAAAAAARQIKLVAEVPEEDLTVRADEEGARTIFYNLIDNAIKYTPPGGVVTVRCVPAAEHVAIEVQDTGIGIAEKDQARVFERFYRVDKSRTREKGGTGLGLAIVKHLAQAFGGGVSLESEPGQGSRFRVHLPRK